MAKILENQECNKIKGCDICFIITPIGDDGSITRKKTDGLIDNVIKPVCGKLNLKAIPAHEIDKPGSITNQVIQMIMDAKMVIANLTELNPNVMYELAIRHAAKLPVICLAEEGTKLPFDITTERTVFYSDDMFGAICLKPKLESLLMTAIKDENVDNPVYRAIKEKQIIKEIQSSDNKESTDSLLYILRRLDDIEKAIKPNASSRDYLITISLSEDCSDFKKELCDLIDKASESLFIRDYNIGKKMIKIISSQRIPMQFIDTLNKVVQNKYNIEITRVDRINDIPIG